MNYLQDNNKFTTVEEGEKQLEEAKKILGAMTPGTIYHAAVAADCRIIELHLNELKRHANS